MEDFGAPSFSLGLDLDFDSEEPQQQEDPREESVAEEAAPINVVSSQSLEEEEEEGEEFGSTEVDQDLEAEERPSVFKRLRRGHKDQSSCTRKKDSVPLTLNVDDEIEEFSSREDSLGDLFTQSHSVCSSSRLPLHGQKVLTRQSVRKLKGDKTTSISGASVSVDLEASERKLMFPKLTISPIRRLHLLDSDSDSDSDDTSIIESRCNDANHFGSSEKEKSIRSGQSVSGWKRAKLSGTTPQNKDLWENFIPKETFSLPTPALDKFCQEYFRSSKDENTAQSNVDTMDPGSSRGCTNGVNGNAEFYGNMPILPPAYHYFNHDDPRIHRLVRSRLPNFVPLGFVEDGGTKETDAAVIDYMSQFGHGGSSSQVHCMTKKSLVKSMGGRKNLKHSNSKEVSAASDNWLSPKSCASKVLEGRAKGGRKNIKSSCAKEVSQASQIWINPKNCVNNPTDAGRRRVHADGCSAGHWYTDQNGRKVYVTRNGQELTGQSAYKQYKKESGKGFKRSRKKTTSKKKSGRIK